MPEEARDRRTCLPEPSRRPPPASDGETCPKPPCPLPPPKHARPTEMPACRQPERAPPLRFVWTMDAEEHFNYAASDFAERDGSAHRRGDRAAVARDRIHARARSGRPRRKCDRVARHLERHCDRMAGRRRAGERAGRIVRPADFSIATAASSAIAASACAARSRHDAADRAHRTSRRATPRVPEHSPRPSRARCSPSCRR